MVDDLSSLSKDIGKVAVSVAETAVSAKATHDRLHEFIKYQHERNHDVANFMQRIDSRGSQHEERYKEIKEETAACNAKIDALDAALRAHMEEENKTVRRLLAAAVIWLSGSFISLIVYIWNAARPEQWVG